eukprot:686586-Prorocentrum_minimum.AAC.1
MLRRRGPRAANAGPPCRGEASPWVTRCNRPRGANREGVSVSLSQTLLTLSSPSPFPPPSQGALLVDHGVVLLGEVLLAGVWGDKVPTLESLGVLRHFLSFAGGGGEAVEDMAFKNPHVAAVGMAGWLVTRWT